VGAFSVLIGTGDDAGGGGMVGGAGFSGPRVAATPASPRAVSAAGT
jgi:hypothetical protein